MLKNLILISSFLLFGKGHTKEEQNPELLPITEAFASPAIYESVNVITGEYCESQTDLTLSTQLNIKRVHNSKDPLALGWFFNQPIIIEHDDTSLPDLSSKFEFDDKNRLKTVRANGKWMQVEYPAEERCVVEDSQGKWIEYHLMKNTGARDLNPTLLEKVHYWDGREHAYEYVDHPREHKKLISKRQNTTGNYLINEYYENTDFNILRDPRVGSVKQQKAPVGSDDTPIVITRFNYQMGFTEVYDALNNKTVYRHGKWKKLTAIESYLGENLYRIERYKYDDKGQLISKSLEDGTGKCVQTDHLRYDSWGNIIEHTLEGDLTGTGNLNESYKTIYRYSNDNRHLLVFHSSDNGVAVRYDYKEGSSLLCAKLTYDHGQLKKREFYQYDEHDNLIEGIRDDGITSDQNDLAGVTERHISRMKPHPEHEMPEAIEELYEDLKSGGEDLLKKTYFTFSPTGKVLRQQIYDSEGIFSHSLDFEYDVGGHLIKATDNEGKIIESEYDVEGRLIYYRDTKKEIMHTFDFVDRLIRKEVKEAGKNHCLTSYRYDYNGNCISTIDIFGNEITHTYDSLGREITTTFCDGSSISYEFDLYDRIISSTDAKGYTTRTAYNSRGKPTCIQYPDGSKESFEYTLEGSLHKSVGKDGSYTVYIRDFESRLLETNLYSPENTLISSTKNTYNAFHQTSSTNALGLKTEYFYDGAGRLIKTTDGSRSVEYCYNSLGELCQQKERLGDKYAIIVAERNDKNQLTEMRIEDSNGWSLKKLDVSKEENPPMTEYIYGNCLQKLLTDANGFTMVVSYDSMGRECSVEKRDPHGHIVSKQENQFDLVGNIEFETHTVFKGNLEAYKVTTAYTYGPCNRVESITEAYGTAEQQTTFYSYNQAGQLEKHIKPDGTTLYYTYAPGGAVAEIEASDGSLYYRYHYDAAGNAILVENLIDGTATKRSYNALNQMIQETLSNGLELNYEYDTRGRKTKVTLHDKSQVSYEYDAAYLRAIHRISPLNELLYSHRYIEYDLKGHLKTQNLIGNLGKIDFTFDDSGKYIAQKSEFYEERITYDNQNRPVSSVTFLNNKTNVNTYAYDSQNQLIEETGIHNNTYEYDSIHNRTSKNNSKYTLNLQNEILAAENSLFSYDANGNRINGSKLSYDALNRLITVSRNDLKISYTYDAFGRRMSKSLHHGNEVSTLRFLYEEENEIGSVDELGKIIEFRALGSGKGGEIGAAVAIELNGEIYAPLHDSRGSTRALIDISTGTIVSESSFSAFGEEKTTGDIISPWRYSGKRIDDETGLVYFGKRYYDPNLGRWITKDPLGTPEGPNRYAYLKNDPMSHVDQYGLYSFSDFAGSFWNAIQSFGSSASHTINTFKHHVSFIEYIRPHFDKVAQQIVGRTILHIAGFYQDASECGVHGRGELNNKVRITLINGILNARIDYKITMDYLSDCHGGINVHYVFDATEGWSWDIFKAIAAKFGYVSPQAHMLADTWRKMIDEMGGSNACGLVIHFAHSVGGTHTKAALSLLTPEELKMIRVMTFGSASLIEHPGLESVTNFVSKRDGVPLLDPVGYVRGLLGLNNTIFVGSWIGVPFVDHMLSSSTYLMLIELIGRRFTEDYFIY